MFEWTLTWTYTIQKVSSFLFFSYSSSPTPDKTIGDGACRKTFRRVEEKYIQLLFKSGELFCFVLCVCRVFVRVSNENVSLCGLWWKRNKRFPIEDCVYYMLLFTTLFWAVDLSTGTSASNHGIHNHTLEFFFFPFFLFCRDFFFFFLVLESIHHHRSTMTSHFNYIFFFKYYESVADIAHLDFHAAFKLNFVLPLDPRSSASLDSF